MPDISMCLGVPGVGLCDRCYRKLATPEPRGQSYIDPHYGAGECEYFCDVDDEPSESAKQGE